MFFSFIKYKCSDWLNFKIVVLKGNIIDQMKHFDFQIKACLKKKKATVIACSSPSNL